MKLVLINFVAVRDPSPNFLICCGWVLKRGLESNHNTDHSTLFFGQMSSSKMVKAGFFWFLMFLKCFNFDFFSSKISPFLLAQDRAWEACIFINCIFFVVIWRACERQYHQWTLMKIWCWKGKGLRGGVGLSCKGCNLLMRWGSLGRVRWSIWNLSRWNPEILIWFFFLRGSLWLLIVDRLGNSFFPV